MKSSNSADDPVSPSAPAWVTPAWFAALIVLCYAPVLARLFHQWSSDDDMAHGLFAPVVAGYLAWQRREDLASLKARPSRWGLALGVWGGLQLIAGTWGSNLFLTRTAFMISLVGVILSVWGVPAFRTLLFPLFVLLFMIPAPQFLFLMVTVRLQLLASHLSEAALDILGYTVLRNGNILEMAGQKLSVEQACSGIRSLFSLTFLSLTYSYLAESRVWMRAVVVATAIPAAILMNAARIVLAGVVGEHDPNLAAGIFHGVSGWVIMLSGFGLQIALHRWVLNGIVRYASR